MNKEDRMEATADTAVHTENDYVIELKDVTKDYGDFVLNKVSFNIPRGCICGFVGQNGAGKTTTIRLIMDIIAATSGEIKVFGKDIPDDRTGESLELSAIPGLNSVSDKGEQFGDLIAKYGQDLTGTAVTGEFPLLLKLLDARDTLSVQVHPSDDYALAHSNDPGKTEMWHILEAKPGAEIIYGLADGVDAAAFARAVADGKIGDAMASVPVKAGQTYFIPSGLLHAIGAGIMLYEIQQSSDVTYRLWDFNRTNDKGEKRELHIRQSLDVIDPALDGDGVFLRGVA